MHDLTEFVPTTASSTPARAGPARRVLRLRRPPLGALGDGLSAGPSRHFAKRPQPVDERRCQSATGASAKLTATESRGLSPLIYMSDVGYMTLSGAGDEGVAAVPSTTAASFGSNDFWARCRVGELRAGLWRGVLLPGRRWRVLPTEHAIFHTVFDIDEMPQIPARPTSHTGWTPAEPPWVHRFPAGSLDVASNPAPTPTTTARLMAIAHAQHRHRRRLGAGVLRASGTSSASPRSPTASAST